jgi:hypothetical protein
MPMYQALAAFAAALFVSMVAAIFARQLRAHVMRPIFWLALFAAAAAMSGASALVQRTRHAGTGLTTSYGWPKPFYFTYLSEAGERSSGWELIYFAGNSLFFAGALLIGWTAWRATWQ